MCYACIILLVSALSFTLPANAKQEKTGDRIAGNPIASPTIAPAEPNAGVQPSPSPAVSPSAPAPSASPSGSPAISVPGPDEQAVVRLEIFLDQQGFRPGKIDGRWGEFCGKALQRYQDAKGRPSGGGIDPATLQELQQSAPAYKEYRITREDSKQVGSKVPTTPVGESKLSPTGMLTRSWDRSPPATLSRSIEISRVKRGRPHCAADLASDLYSDARKNLIYAVRKSRVRSPRTR